MTAVSPMHSCAALLDWPEGGHCFPKKKGKTPLDSRPAEFAEQVWKTDCMRQKISVVCWNEKNSSAVKQSAWFELGIVSRLWSMVERAHVSYYHLQNQTWNGYRAIMRKPVLTQPEPDFNPLTKMFQLEWARANLQRRMREKEIPKIQICYNSTDISKKNQTFSRCQNILPPCICSGEEETEK